VDDYVFRDANQRRQIETWIKEKNIPSLLLSGHAGIGKSALAKVLLNEIGVDDFDILKINASRDNGVDFIKDKVINFVQMIPFGQFKVVLMEESDFLSPAAQGVLRDVFDTYSSTSRFILTCNYPQRIMPAIHSRCQGFHIEKLDQTDFTARVATILVYENIEFDLDTLDTYVKAAYPDMRKCINMLQQNSVDGILNGPTLDDHSSGDYMLEVVDLFKDRKIREARKLLCGRVRAEEIETIYTWMYQNSELFGKSEEQQDSAILIIKQGLCDHFVCADFELNLAACLIKLARNFNQN
jgi:DNA polymerase III delta prime subunit